MDVFSIRDDLIRDYRAFTSGTVPVCDRRIRAHVEELLNPALASGGTVADLVAWGLLHPETERIFRNAISDRWDRDWQLGWRDIATSLDAHTFVPSVLPRSAASDTFLLVGEPPLGPLLQAAQSPLVADTDCVARQKLSGTHT